MTVIFGNLIDDFNEFGSGGSDARRFRDSVNDNTSVAKAFNYVLWHAEYLTAYRIYYVYLFIGLFCVCIVVSDYVFLPDTNFPASNKLLLDFLHSHKPLYHHSYESYPKSAPSVHPQYHAPRYHLLWHLLTRLCGDKDINQRQSGSRRSRREGWNDNSGYFDACVSIRHRLYTVLETLACRFGQFAYRSYCRLHHYHYGYEAGSENPRHLHQVR